MQQSCHHLFYQHIRHLPALLLLLIITSSTLRAQQYTGDGIPSGLEEEIRWLLNRGRFDSAAENTTQGTSYRDIPPNTAALAPNRKLTLAGRHHSEDMARNNAFQHETIPGSTYYNSVTQPSPWDRMEAEGYNWNGAGENIAAGYTGSMQVYVGWWKSTGHRVNMYKASHREIGNGHFELPSSTYRHYYTMDLASSSGRSFLTGTLFHDINGDGRYSSSEATSGCRVSLTVNDIAYPQYDISTTVGSFAIPIDTITGGSRVRVTFSNTNNTSINLSIPTAYNAYQSLILLPGQSVNYGEFIHSATTANVGLRSIIPTPDQLPMPVLTGNASRLPSGALNRFTLSFRTQNNNTFSIESSENAQNWQVIESGITGNGNLVIRNYPATVARKFYRLRRE
ncbi:MAG: CAP domain-containing protein [Verrucomicrobiota bacterium]|nr:CAP domain-containing protein [Verrucomicrobiota bacterium]